VVVAKELLKRGADVTQECFYGRGILERIIRSNGAYPLDVADYLIKWHKEKNGGDLLAQPRNRNPWGNTLLHECIKWDWQYALPFLLHYQENPFALNKDGETPVSLAIDKNNAHVFKQVRVFFVPFEPYDVIDLLRDGAQKVQTAFKARDIMKTCYTNKLAELFIVLEQHAASKSTALDGIMMTSKGWCFNNATYGDVERLTGKQGITYVKDILGRICAQAQFFVYYDWEKFTQEVARYPFIVQWDKQRFFDICFSLLNDQEDCSWLLTFDADPFEYDVTYADEDGNTLLHHAVLLNKPWAVALLATKPDTLLLCNKQGKTALDMSVASDDKTCLKAMLECIVDKCSDWRFDAFLYRKEIKKLFKGIKHFDAFIVDGKPLLHRMAATGWFELCAIMLKNDARVDEQDGDGRTALWYANTRNILLLLLARGADKCITPEIIEKWTPKKLGEWLRMAHEGDNQS